MDLLKLIKQRRDKYSITQKKSDIEYGIANKIINLYKEAIFKFQDDLRFWIAYIKFCKNVRFQSNVSRMLERMLQIHQDKPKCWLIAAQWEMEENKNKTNALQYLLQGLFFHPTSQILYIDAIKLELEDAMSKSKEKEEEEKLTPSISDKDHIPPELKRVHVLYQQAFKEIKDIKFIVQILDIVNNYKNTEELQNRIISDMIEEYVHEPLMWDTMAKRELKGLVQPSLTNSIEENDDTLEYNSLRDRINSCNKVYQTAVKKIKTEEMYSYYIECLIEINQQSEKLPNFKKKLLKTALSQAHQAKKLKEKYYLYWIDLLDKDETDETNKTKLKTILSSATEIIPDSINLWNIRLRHLIASDLEDESATVFNEATRTLGEKSLPLWKMRLMYVQAKNPEGVEDIFKAALQAELNIAKEIKPIYIEWLVLSKNIHEARKVYECLAKNPPFSLELHTKMAEIELMQPEISLNNARLPYEMSILQFGKINVNVWLDYIKFEMNHGDIEKPGKIHARAVKTLEPNLTESFISEYSLFKANFYSMTTTS
ncbi:U3 small nucleolar RNA-associated protein 6 homolog isoform X2 [Prorops nasuta]